MKELKQYILEVLGQEIVIEKVQKNKIELLPLFLKETYRLVQAKLFDYEFIIAESLNFNEFTVIQTKKHLELIHDVFNKKVILTADTINAQIRKRLIEKGINFIVPGKQLFLPELLIDLREDYRFSNENIKAEKLLPSAQLIVFYWILSRKKKPVIEEMTFQELAEFCKYSKMTLTYAAENLKQNDVCIIVGDKEKYLKFKRTIPETWKMLEEAKKFINPVFKRVFIDEIHGNPNLLISNESALPEFTDMNPSKQEYRAILKRDFDKYLNDNIFVGLNDREGKFCLEIWKYLPMKSNEYLKNNLNLVDPLSLYITLKDNRDDRIQLALNQIIKKYIW